MDSSTIVWSGIAQGLGTGFVYVPLATATFATLLPTLRNEGTAIFKVTSTPPEGNFFDTYEGQPADWYLRLTRAATKMIRGDIPLSVTMPENP